MPSHKDQELMVMTMKLIETNRKKNAIFRMKKVEADIRNDLFDGLFSKTFRKP